MYLNILDLLIFQWIHFVSLLGSLAICKKIRKVSQNVVPPLLGPMTFLCNYCDMGYYI